MSDSPPPEYPLPKYEYDAPGCLVMEIIAIICGLTGGSIVWATESLLVWLGLLVVLVVVVIVAAVRIPSLRPGGCGCIIMVGLSWFLMLAVAVNLPMVLPR